jgi:asparagine N-glycosylation enzyme membrane subunit Stt3
MKLDRLTKLFLLISIERTKLIGCLYLCTLKTKRMYIVYLILLVIAIVFKMMHWPGSALILLFSVLFPLLDVIVQLVRKTKDKEARIWSAVAMLFWSVFMVFKFLHWPGEMVLLVPAVVFTAIMVLRMIQNKNKFSFRLISIVILAVFGIFNSTLKGSNFTLMYMIEDPFDKNGGCSTFLQTATGL